MEGIIQTFRRGFLEQNGHLVAQSLTPIAPSNDPARLYEFYQSYTSFTITTELRYAMIYDKGASLGFTKAESTAWIEVFVAYWKAIGQILPAEELLNQGKGDAAKWEEVYESWKVLLQQLYQGYAAGHFPAWTIPCLYVAGKYLRNFAVKADEQFSAAGATSAFDSLEEDAGVSKNRVSEDAARQINRLFGLCFSDRAPLEESRKWGLYYIANLLFKVYFRVNSLNLCKNVLRSLQASGKDLPPLSSFPKAHQVTFNYYAGVISFLEEDYKKAEEHLTQAWSLCNKKAHKNRQLILTYLIPCHMLHDNAVPRQATLRLYPSLYTLFSPLINAVKHGDLYAFDAALAGGEATFVKRKVYLTLERTRDLAMRNLFRKVYLAAGYDELKEGQTAADRVRRSRISINEFAAAIAVSSKPKARHRGEYHKVEPIDLDEVECWIANMIYKNYMKGYIARERAMVVLNKKGAFPGTGI